MPPGPPPGRCYGGWFQNNGGGFDAGVAQVFGDQESVAFIAHYHRGRKWSAAQPLRGFLQHALAGHQIDKLFGVQLPGYGPQPLPEPPERITGTIGVSITGGISGSIQFKGVFVIAFQRRGLVLF